MMAIGGACCSSSWPHSCKTRCCSFGGLWISVKRHVKPVQNSGRFRQGLAMGFSMLTPGTEALCS